MMEFVDNLLCLAPILIIIMWVPLLLLASRTSGWSRLAGYYQFHSEFVGQKWRPRFRYVYLGSGRYGNTLTIGANYHGLYLAMSSLFEFGHPSLLIPWKDITTAEHKGLIFSYLDFTFALEPTVKLRVPRKLGDEILAVRYGPT